MKIVILDNSTGKVHIFDYNPELYNDVEDFFDDDICAEHNIREGDTTWMVVSNLNIQIH